MKAFNKEINITVQVDAIANLLLAQFPAEYKHRELVTEAVIGSLFNCAKLEHLYNALNGFNNDINFKIGDTVLCTDTYYTGDISVEIGKATIKEIDIYRSDKLLVEFDRKARRKNKGDLEYTETVERDTRWVYHTYCTKLVTIETLADLMNAANEDELKTMSQSDRNDVLGLSSEQ